MWGALRDIGGRTMSDEFRSLDERERTALEAALKRCRVLADQIESILRNESPHFVDRVSLADFYASIQPCLAVTRRLKATGIFWTRYNVSPAGVISRGFK